MRVGYGSFVVLEDVDLTVANGEIVAVTGVNGAGKSTLLSCLAGLHRPAAGTVTVLGGPPRDDAAFWRAVALVADQPAWYPGLNTRSFGLIAVGAVAAAGAAALLVRRMLPHFPAGVVRAGSARAGTVLLAAAFLNVPLLTWIAED